MLRALAVTDESSMIEEKLESIYLEYVSGKSPDLDDLKENHTEMYLLLLLSIFSYSVNQGGFAQLLYNLNWVYLEDVELTLEIVGAENSKLEMSNVIQLCIDNAEAYQEFISSDFSESKFKNILHKQTLAYMSSGAMICSELSKDMLNGICRDAKIS